MSASGQPMEMKATVSFLLDRNTGLELKFETAFVVDDPSGAEERGTQMRDAVTSFVEGYGAET